MRFVATLLAIAVAALLPTAPAAYAAEKRHAEETVSLDQVPAPVKATIEKGKTFWEAQITKNGKEEFLHVADNGKVLKRESAKAEHREEQKESKKESK